ncbi:unnamed protein product [Cyprideis torosa]|uniref:urocanate hydratase n=1 Tax=Cyprideis torosa TaxID=163714 RepID=A0A7R8ZI82_9CRUS|nr:unnamed protein product [Cyprideis torosa]CAG0885510.1 unnamed protein product [Cyprideis torosa]
MQMSSKEAPDFGLKNGIPFGSEPFPRTSDIVHAPVRKHNLSTEKKRLAVSNALRYFPTQYHKVLAQEFMQELEYYGHIYMYRFRPRFAMKAYPVDQYPTKSKQAACIIHMIMNNLDPSVAQFPEELVTYGGNGQVFSNWAQFWLVLQYLCEMEDDQTLVMYSGHPLGLFPSNPDSPRVVITNGMVVPNYSSKSLYDDFFALGVSMYGQMTAGSYCYIGPQGIVHGTTITLMNAGRKYLGVDCLRGKVFVTSGLGGMSGAQGKAAVIAGCVGVVAEVSEEALMKRFKQGWVQVVSRDLDEVIDWIRKERRKTGVLSIGYHGNVVALWERLVEDYQKTGEKLVDLGSDQTSCHNPFNGGYYPVQLTFEQSQVMMAENPEGFKWLVQESLRRHVNAINFLNQKTGLSFWDYGNAFLLEASRAGADVRDPRGDMSGLKFKYPSYVQDIMGDVFSMGFGPFRWVCVSRVEGDLDCTDQLASEVLREQLERGQDLPPPVRAQIADNLHWVTHAKSHRLVVGSQARILYSDHAGRIQLARAFNDAVRRGMLGAPVVISRDHHDVSGTDSPFRETSNICDGSAFTADMSVQNFVGGACRGATWVALHNGGGVGWGEVVNGGFGLVLDGSEDAGTRAQAMLSWDVSNGVARRSWSGNAFAREAISRTMRENPKLKVTMPSAVAAKEIFEFMD